MVAAGPEKQPVSLLAGDIRHIKPVPASLNSEESSLLNQPLYWSSWMLPALVVGGVWLWQHRRQHLLMNTAYARSQRAKRAAQKILLEAQHSSGDSYAAAHRALLGYLSDKLNRPTTGLTTDHLVALLKTTQLDPALIQRTQATLDQIDAGRFAPGGEAAAGSLIAETHKLINDLEKSFRELQNKN
jgi:hypothetical protein